MDHPSLQLVFYDEPASGVHRFRRLLGSKGRLLSMASSTMEVKT
jgi:hypothetical protein